MEENINQIEKIVKNTREEDFLQSSLWAKFQEKVGRKTHCINSEFLNAILIEHTLPIVGKYFYAPHGPVINNLQSSATSHQMTEMVKLAKEENVAWIRIEPKNEESLKIIKENIQEKIVKAPHDMQPKEIFAIDITKNTQQLMSEMKPKTRYNIGLAKKKGVSVTCHQSSVINDDNGKKYVDAFLKLTKEMAQRHGIVTHPEKYYLKMIESFGEKLKIYVAEFNGKIIATNLILFHGKTATYLHGASGNEHRNVMAPFLLQWQAILDAKENGFEVYDFGGVQTSAVKHQKHSDLVGVTNFKLGFSTTTKTIVFPGSYDIILNPKKYWMYRGLQKAKSFAARFRK